MSIYEIKSNSDDQTRKIAAKVALLLNAGDVVTLEGELGTGKTTFTKGIAQGLDINRMVTSPTFTIVKEYDGNLPLYHIDAYRLEHSEEDIGFSEYFNSTGVSVVEWAQFIEEHLPNERLNIKISYVDEDSRIIQFEPIGDHYEKVIKNLINDDMEH